MFSVICFLPFCIRQINAALLLLGNVRNQTFRTFLKKEMDCFFFSVSQMGTDQRDERWRVEETCSIKMKR